MYDVELFTTYLNDLFSIGLAWGLVIGLTSGFLSWGLGLIFELIKKLI